MQADQDVGSRVGEFRLLRRLGHGGMGIVYAAEHVSTNRPAAVKVLLREHSSRGDLIQRFFNEARATARLRHPGFADVLASGTAADGRAFIAMDLLEGETLGDRLVRDARVPLGEALEIARQVAAAMAVAHHAGIIHRDLTPRNIFLERSPAIDAPLRVRVLDFGIAKLLDGGDGHDSVTRTGAIFGTPKYMPPEQCRSSTAVDERADIYALGCIVYAMICGRPPFDLPTPAEVIAAHLYDSPRPLHLLEPSVPLGLSAAVAAALAKRPEDRPSSMEVFADSLVRGARGETPVTTAGQGSQPAPTMSLGAWIPAVDAGAHRRRRRQWLVAATAVVAGLGALGAVAAKLDLLERLGVRSGPLHGTPRLLARGPGVSAFPFLATDGAGSAVFAWRQSERQKLDLWTARYDPRTGWSAPRRLEHGDGDARTVTLAMTRGGRAVAIWRQSDGQRYQQWSSRMDPAGTWSAPERLDRDGHGEVGGNDVAMGADGTIVAIWEQGSKDEPALWGATWSSDGGWTAPVQISQASGAVKDREVSAAGAGGAMAVWVQRDASGRSAVHASRFMRSRGWGTPRVIDRETDGSVATTPDVSTNARGDALAVWNQEHGRSRRVYGARFTPSEGWGAAQRLGPVDGWADAPHLGMDEGGGAAVVWPEEGHGIKAAVFDPRAGWKPPVTISAATTTAARRAWIAVDGDGSALASWEQHGGADTGVWLSKFLPGRGWGRPWRLEGQGNAGNGPMVAWGGGRGFAIWAQDCDGHACISGMMLE